ncbi:MAG: hypothetical protein R3A10_19560 [Caldilineaceae bacterium]
MGGTLLLVGGIRYRQISRWRPGCPFLWSTLQGYMLSGQVFLDPQSNPAAPFNIYQAHRGGCGRLDGQVVLGSQNQLHLRVRHTDFIFSVIAEAGPYRFGAGIGAALLRGLVLLRIADRFRTISAG